MMINDNDHVIFLSFSSRFQSTLREAVGGFFSAASAAWSAATNALKSHLGKANRTGRQRQWLTCFHTNLSIYDT